MRTTEGTNVGGGGVGLGGMLFVAFVVLKLCGVIDWSWWWVTSPLWGSVALIVALVVVIVPFSIYMDSRQSAKHAREYLRENRR